MTNNNLKIYLKIIALLFLWFLVADAYWVTKERKVEQCSFLAANDVLKNKLEYVDNLEDGLYNLMLFYRKRCSFAEGSGWLWDNPHGMAYWELVLLLPVANRFQF